MIRALSSLIWSCIISHEIGQIEFIDLYWEVLERCFFSPYFMKEILDCKTITEMCLCVVEIDICDAYR